MAYNTKPIITDVDGNPISQYYNKELDQFEPVEGQAGANKVVLYNADGTENNSLSLIPILDKLSQLTGTVIDEEIRKSNELQRQELYNQIFQMLEDGELKGDKGDTGNGLEFNWQGTSLGVREEGQIDYVYVDLQGPQGPPGTIENLTSQHIEDALGYIPATTDSVDTVQQELNEHIKDIYENEVHGMRIINGKLEYWDGQEWKQIAGGSGSQVPLGNVVDFTAEPDDGKVILRWKDPEDIVVDGIVISKWAGTKILRKTGSYPANENDGVLVVDSGVRNQYEIDGFEDTGLQNNVEYFYMAFPYTTDEVYTVDIENRVSAIPTAQKIYGVEIDESNSNPETAVTYTDDSVGFIPARGNNGNFDWGSWENIIKEEFKIRPCVLKNLGGGNAEVNYYLDYDDYTKKADGSNARLDGTDGDVMIEFGVPLWWKFSRVGSKLKIQLSNREFDGAVKYAFEIEDGYNLVPFYPFTLTQIIYLLMFKHLDSQTALGRGYVDGNTDFLNTGTSNNRPFMFGETTGKQQIKFLGMEDYWGNRRWWIDGCFYDNNQNMLIGKGNFNDEGNGYTNYGQATPSDGGGYIDKIQGQNETGFIPASISGSATTFYCDYGSVYAGRLPSFGGYRSNGGRAGAFSLTSDTAAASDALIGGRLFYSKDSKIYTGAYLGVNQGGKLRSISGYESHNNATIGEFRTLARANN